MNKQASNSLWSENFPNIDIKSISCASDLRLIQEKFNKYDPYYVRAGVIKKSRDRFDYEWKSFKNLADSHFRKEIQLHFHERSWEMWFWNYLTRQFSWIASNNKWPDFIFNNIYLECIALTKWESTDKNGKPLYDYVPLMKEWIQDVPINQILLRITHGIKEKWHNKYYWTQNKKGWAHENYFNINYPYILAINIAELDYIIEIDDLLGILFWIGNQIVNINTHELSYLFRPFIEKSNKEKISSLIFESKDYENISWIIFCNKNILHEDKDIEESLILIHNPYAKNQINEKLFSNIQQYKATETEIIKIA